MVMYKKSILGVPEKTSSELVFQRVRKVTIDTDGYMTCTCGYVQRMLMPCTHICAVIGKTEYYEPSMFHVWWYKMFNYFYRDKQQNECCLKTNDAVEDLLQVTRENAYDRNGKYKGIYGIFLDKTLFGYMLYSVLRFFRWAQIPLYSNYITDR